MSQQSLQDSANALIDANNAQGITALDLRTLWGLIRADTESRVVGSGQTVDGNSFTAIVVARLGDNAPLMQIKPSDVLTTFTTFLDQYSVFFVSTDGETDLRTDLATTLDDSAARDAISSSALRQFFTRTIDLLYAWELPTGGSGEPTPDPPPEPTGTQIVQFRAGDLTPSAWNAKRSGYPAVDATVYGNASANTLATDQAHFAAGTASRSTIQNPRASQGGNSGLDLPIGHLGISGNSSSAEGNGSTGRPGQLWRFNAGHEIPEMNSAGELICKKFVGMHDQHNMIQPVEDGGNPLGGFQSVTSWIPGKKYSYKVRFTFPDNYDNGEFLFDQLRGDGFVGPQIGLYSFDGEVKLRQFDPDGVPNQWKFSPVLATLSPGLVINVRADIVLSQGGSGDPQPLTRYYFNNELVYEDTTPNYSGVPLVQHTLGFYDYTGNMPESQLLLGQYELWFEEPAPTESFVTRVDTGQTNTDGEAIYEYQSQGNSPIVQSQQSGDFQSIGASGTLIAIEQPSTGIFRLVSVVNGNTVYTRNKVSGRAQIDRWGWAENDSEYFAILTDDGTDVKLDYQNVNGDSLWSHPVTLPNTASHPLETNPVTLTSWRGMRGSGHGVQYVLARGIANGEEHDFMFPVDLDFGVLHPGVRSYWEMTNGLDRIIHNGFVWEEINGNTHLYASPGGTGSGSATNNEKTFASEWDGSDNTQIEPVSETWSHQTQFGNRLLYALFENQDFVRLPSSFSGGVVMDEWPLGPHNARTDAVQLWDRADFVAEFDTAGVQPQNVGMVHGVLLDTHAIFNLKLFNMPGDEEETILVCVNISTGASKVVAKGLPEQQGADFSTSNLPSMTKISTSKGRAAWQGVGASGHLRVYTTEFDLP